MTDLGGDYGRHMSSGIMTETRLQEWPDGHTLLRDKWQWIVRHPAGCGNGEGPHVTYFFAEDGLREELSGCHIRLASPAPTCSLGA